MKKGPHLTKNRVHGAHGQPEDYDMDDYVHYGNTGCRVIKREVQNWKDFWLKFFEF